MKIYIITHKYSTTLKKCLARYKELGYNPIIYNGLNITEDKIEKSQVCYLNYLKLLENDDCADDDIIISEDDVYLNEKIEIKNYLDFIVRPETICKEISHKSLIVDKVRKHRHILR